jgi:hypothetical protein
MTRHSLIWLFIVLMIFIFSPLVVSRTTFEATMDTEVDSAYRWYGEETAIALLDRTNSLYASAMVKTGIDPFIRKYGTNAPGQDIISQQFEKAKDSDGYKANVRDYWGNLLRNIWMFCFRMAHAWGWMLWVCPFLIAIIYDGIMVRKAKLATFKYTSPTIYNLSWHLIIFLAALGTIMFAVATPLNVFLFPSVLVAMGVNVRLLISNIQHSA